MNDANDARLSTTFRGHRKTRRLLRIGPDYVVGFIWVILWARDERPDGSLSGMTAEDIELSIDWRGPPNALVEALVTVGFLDQDDDGYHIHDWAEHQPWAAGAQTRSDKSRWAAHIKNNGFAYAVQAMPEYYQLHKEKCDQYATRTQQAHGNTAKGRKTSAPSPLPSPSPLPLPKPSPSPLPKPKSTPIPPEGDCEDDSQGSLFGQPATLLEPKKVSSRKKKEGRAPVGGSCELPSEWTDERRAALLEWLGYKLDSGSQITADRFATLREETAALNDVQLKACVEDAIRRHAKELSPHKFSGRQLDMFDDSSYVEEIYKAYPRKIGKPQALRAIAKAMRSAPIEGRKLLELPERYSVATAGWPDEDRQFIPHPSTWFNGHRFNDDPVEWQRTQPAPQKKGGARPSAPQPEFEPVLKPEGDGEPNRYAEAWAALYDFDRPPWVHCPDSNRGDVLNWIESHGGDDV